MGKDGNVGNPQLYEDGDQRNYSRKEEQQRKSEARFEEGKPQSHQATDSKDSRTIANRLAAAEAANKSDSGPDTAKDPCAPAMMHGNEPSRGAKIDAEIQKEEEEILARKAGKTDSLPGKK